MIRAVVLALLALTACGDDAPRLVTVVLHAPADLDLHQVTFEPAAAVRDVQWTSGPTLVLEVDPKQVPDRLRFDHPEACSVALSMPAEGDASAFLSPMLDLGEPVRPQIGYDTAFTVEARLLCDEARGGTLTWAQVGGAPLPLFHVQGVRVSAKTPTPEAAGLDLSRTLGVIPISPRTRGEAVIEAKLRLAGGREITRRVTVSAASRASGMPSIAEGHDAYLYGTGWTVEESGPEGAHATLRVAGALTIFSATAGRYLLRDDQQRPLRTIVQRFDDMPLDCGRPDCHAAEAARALASPMTTIFQRGLRGEIPGYEPTCAVSCHTLGEPGTDDGGFTNVARATGFTDFHAPAGQVWENMPRALRRQASVGCAACHGPAAIPEATARFRILRTDVCATCHDAPPRYSYITALASSPMSRADASEGTRAAPCAGCHTTEGFLDAIGARALTDDRRAPDDASPAGVSCAACHAVHGADVGISLVRRVAPPASLGEIPSALRDGVSNVCLRCHSPSDARSGPEASNAALWLGRGGFDRHGAPLEMPPVHLADNGCVSCHGAPDQSDPASRGEAHAFKASRTTCVSCHTGGAAPDDGMIQARALSLATRLGIEHDEARPPHATVQRAPTQELAARNVRLVLEDPGAAVHHPAYARALLDEAEAMLGDP